MMKYKIIMCCFLISAQFGHTWAQENTPSWVPGLKLGKVVEIELFENFYTSGDFYLGGQPSLDALQWLKSEGVGLVINLRSETENEDFSREAFSEEKIVKELGMEYKTVPVNNLDSYIPEKLDELIDAINSHKGKVFIHCTSCGRVRIFFMAYLVKARKYTVDEALAFGRSIGFNFLLEGLLGSEIKMGL